MSIWLILAATVALFVVTGIVAFAYVGWRMSRPPKGWVEDVLERGHAEGRLLVCMGDSITRGRIGADWVESVRRRFDGKGWTVVNAGVNGEVVWNLRQRLDPIRALRPDAVVLLVGTNDCMAADLPQRAAAYRKGNGLPRVPDLDWSREQLQALLGEIRGLSPEDGAPALAICTIPPLGGHADASGEVVVRRWNEAVSELAGGADADLLDLHGALWPTAQRGGQPYEGGLATISARMLGAGAGKYVAARSWDAIGRRGGWGATVDSVHLDDTSAGIVQTLVGDWLDRLG